jgi:acyl-CoA thioester hydrolase
VTTGTTTLRVRYAETDQMGFVYYANYFVWFEVARGELLRSHGWTYREMEGTGVMLPVIDAACEYLRPARYDDQIEVQTQGTLVSPVRMSFTYEVRVTSGGKDDLVANGRTLHAAVDRRGRPCRLPQRIAEVFA